jgi:type IV secretory pathway TraG/TraD family ATPase VirD4
MDQAIEFFHSCRFYIKSAKSVRPCSSKVRENPIRLDTINAVGQTGTGKSTMFESMILSDIEAGEGLCVLDPHGDLIEKLLYKIPLSRKDDVVILDPRDLEYPVGFNILEYEDESQKYFLLQEIIAIIERLISDSKMDPTIAGPLFFQHMRMALQLVMSNPDDIGTIAQFYQIFNSRNFYKRFLPLRSNDPVLKNWVDAVLSVTDYTRQGSEGSSLGGWVSSKFEGFVNDPMLRNIFGQSHSTINLRDIMDTGKIFLVNLSKGRVGEINSRFFGMIMIAKLQAAAMARASQPIEQRRDFYLYVDEFQNLATSHFETLLSEARKYRLNLILTNQFVTQIDPRITSAIAGNVGTLIVFRVGTLDAEYLEREFLPEFNRYDITNLPNFNTCVTTLVEGQVSKPFSMRTILDKTPMDAIIAAAIKDASRHQFSRDQQRVETEISESMMYEERRTI